jgi:hypothetical protein
MPFPATASLLPGHHSGVRIDQEMTRRLVLSVPGVTSCDMHLRHDRHGKGELHTVAPEHRHSVTGRATPTL